MKPVDELDCSNLVGLLTDIDDTLTTDGKLLPEAFAALWRLSETGIHVIPVTGRSAGWAHMAIKTWPVTAVVAESGGLYLYRNPQNNRIEERLHAEATQVKADYLALQQCGDRIIAQVPGLAPASDNPFRRVDYALDYCEEVDRVSDDEVARALAMFRAKGFSARASSVHINAWRGDFDKGPMALRLLAEHFDDGNNSHLPERWIFVGDAPNDASMFALFPRSVGVANILGSLDRLPVKPAFVTRQACGAGFVELAEVILRSRGDQRR